MWWSIRVRPTEREGIDDRRYAPHASVEEYGAGAFKAGIGAEAIRELLRKIDIDALWDELHMKAKASTSAAMKKKYCKAHESD